jgi:eukaryotic translation initiation factor 2C
MPPRPGYGRLGTKTVVRANHFLVNVAERELNHYDVTISPEVPSKKINRDIIQLLDDQYRKSHFSNLTPAYDGRKSLYTAGELPFLSKDFEVTLPDKDKVGEPGSSSSKARRDRKFTVTIKWAAKLDIYHLKQFIARKQMEAPHETIQLLDVVLRATPSQIYTVVGRSFFSTDLGKKGELGNGMEYWRGYYQSLRPTQMGLSLNIDVSARAFYEPICVIAFIAKYLNLRDVSRGLSDQDRIKVKRALRAVKVKLSHGKYVKSYKITGVTDLPVGRLMFTLDDNQTQTSVAQYFRDRYKIVLKFPNLPALQAGSSSKPVYLPMELCTIVEGQRYSKKLNETQVTNLLRATCQRPLDREGNIVEMVKKNEFDKNELVSKQFGIDVTKNMTMIEARVLDPPQVKYNTSGRESTVNPRFGSWNMINKKMYEGARIDYWTCVCFSTRVDMRLQEEFCFQLIDMCTSKGLVFGNMPIIPFIGANPRVIEKTLVDIHTQSNDQLQRMNLKDKQLQLLIVILPDVTGSYGKIKRICETELGIVSQCCLPKNVSKLSKQYFENVALKINVKTGGRNSVLTNAVARRIPQLTDRPTIVFGADVTHPQPGEDSSPSVAAVVASMDWPEVSKYHGIVSSQNHREEIIQDLYKKTDDPQRGVVHSGMIRELLIAHYRSTGDKPHRILFYRDGVSEGQFSQVLLYEIDAIRMACKSLQEGYQPRITFVVVQKRHHTRLFPADHNNRNSMDKSGNILPGTVVDTSICHPSEFDFYLNSHAGIQGTSRPAHYHVLFDENKFTADEMQALTNNLCYTYARCTKAVSIVPPAYYAHLAAFRARYYIEGEVSDQGSTSAGGTVERTAPVVRVPVIKDNVKKVMFYC